MIKKDKIYHIIAGMLIYIVMSTILLSDVIALMTVVLIAVVKELYDAFNPEKHTADVYDALATIIPALILFIIEILFLK